MLSNEGDGGGGGAKSMHLNRQTLPVTDNYIMHTICNTNLGYVCESFTLNWQILIHLLTTW